MALELSLLVWLPRIWAEHAIVGLDSRMANVTYDPGRAEASGGYRVLLEFFLPSRGGGQVRGAHRLRLPGLPRSL